MAERVTTPVEFSDERPFEESRRGRQARAGRLLRQTSRNLGLPEAVRDVRYIGTGLTYETFGARIDGVGVVIRIPHGDALETQSRWAVDAATLLDLLSTLELPFEMPRTLALVTLPEGTAVVQTRLSGMPLWRSSGGPKVPRLPGTTVAEQVARVAAAIHGIDVGLAAHLERREATRGAHLAAFGSTAERLGPPFDTEIADWIRGLAADDAPPRLLHGDLLGQNLLICPSRDRLGVIDWEEAQIGDPAYDLAVVTRGRRRPLGRVDGLRRVLDAYGEQAVEPIPLPRVRAFEMGILMHCADICDHPAERADLRRQATSFWRRIQAERG